jgi:hypothetical protein
MLTSAKQIKVEDSIETVILDTAKASHPVI